MTYGIQCFNTTTGEMTLSSEAYTFCYLGKATLSSVNHFTGTDQSSQAGDATWTYNYDGPIVAALEISPSKGAGRIRSVSKVGSTWYIHVEQYTTSTEGTSTATYGLPSSTSNVYVFGLPTSLPAYGVALYNASGLLTGDLSRIPLQVGSKLYFDSSTSGISGLPTYTKPAIIGFPNYQRFDSVADGSFWINTTYVGLWSYASNTLSRNGTLYTYDHEDSSVTARTIQLPTYSMIIEANGLT